MQAPRTIPAGDVYDRTTIGFHWIVAAIVLALFFLALCPGFIKGSIALHKSLGLMLLIVVPLRMIWRLCFGRRTQTSSREPFILRLGAQAAHLAIYALLLIIPMLGWLYQDAKAIDVDPFGLEVEMPTLIYYNYHLATQIYLVKQIAAYSLLALIGAHAGAAVFYHHLLRGDGVLRSMLPRCLRRGRLAAGFLAVSALAAAPARADTAFDAGRFAADLAASLSKACPMASPSDSAAYEACRKNIGQGAESAMRGYSFLFGGQQPGHFWLKDKKTSVFRGDLFQDLYMSLYMYTGKFRVEASPDGLTAVAVQAYFRNGLPPGLYPYPFWHSEAKWDAYEKSNELRFRVDKTGKVVFAYRADIGSNENRGPYAHVERPPFLGEWMWRDDTGGAQPAATLFSSWYSPDNPNLNALDAAYRKMARNFRDADCTGCHQPEGHRKMNKLTLLQTPLHAATGIEAVLAEVRAGRMPVDDYDDPRPLPSATRAQLLENGEAFKQMLATADAWEVANKRPKARRPAAD